MISHFRFRNRICNIIIFITLLTLQYLKNVIQMSPQALLLFTFLLLFLTIHILFVEKIRYKILILIIYGTVMFLGESATYQFFKICSPTVIDNTFSDARSIFIVGTISRLIVLLLLLGLRKFLSRRNQYKCKIDTWIWAVVIPTPVLFCSVMFLYSPFALLSEDENSVLFWWCIIALVIALIYMTILTVWIIKERRIREQLQQAEQYVSVTQDRMSVLECEQQKVRGTIHDIKNHLDYLKEAAPETQHTYIDELDDKLDFRHNITGNYIIDTVLSLKQPQIPEGVVFTTEGKLPSILPGLKDIDLVTLLGNGLDNAIEAVKDIPGGEIRIRFDYDGASLALFIRNSYSGQVFGSTNLPASTKQKPGHGFGIGNMQKVVDCYDGFFSLEGDGKYCVLKILLQNRDP